MNRMNSRVDEIQDFIKINVLVVVDDMNGKQVSFADQLPSKGIANPMNLGQLSSATENVNYVYVDKEAVEKTLVISNLWSGKNLSNPYKDHLIHKGLTDEETLTNVAEQDSSFEDEDE